MSCTASEAATWARSVAGAAAGVVHTRSVRRSPLTHMLWIAAGTTPLSGPSSIAMTG